MLLHPRKVFPANRTMIITASSYLELDIPYKVMRQGLKHILVFVLLGKIVQYNL
jgi:hypothetical protein